MQLYALDESSRCIQASRASKQRDYRCLECFGPVRARGGILRQPHFFHLERSDACRQSGKSPEHLAVQLYLQNLLPPGDCVLEMRFDAINRIADVVWLSEKLIFEVQCSPISPAEVLERTASYSKQGYQVVWIFHDHQYNRYKVSSAEKVCRPPFYYTNINKDGEGIVYDQFSLNRLNKKITRGAVYPIDPAQPKHSYRGELYFQGDRIDLEGFKSSEFEIPKTFNPWALFKSIYELLIRFYLEKSSK